MHTSHIARDRYINRILTQQVIAHVVQGFIRFGVKPINWRLDQFLFIDVALLNAILLVGDHGEYLLLPNSQFSKTRDWQSIQHFLKGLSEIWH